MHTAVNLLPSTLVDGLLGHVTRPDTMAWIPGGPGKSSRPLRFLGDHRGFVELFRLEPGTVVPPHRHTGEVHAFSLQGTRQLGTGEIVGPGGYVYEPPGNVDTWKIVGNEAAVIFVVVMGEVQYLGPNAAVTGRCDAVTQWQAYCDHCREIGVDPIDLREPS